MARPQVLTVIPQTTSFRALGAQREHEGGLASPGEEVSLCFQIEAFAVPVLRICLEAVKSEEARGSSLT